MTSNLWRSWGNFTATGKSYGAVGRPPTTIRAHRRYVVGPPSFTLWLMSDDRPKRAVELAMERMRQKDADSGVGDRPPTEEQKAAIADARSLRASKLAELEILHRSTMAGMFDPAARIFPILRSKSSRSRAKSRL